MCGWEWASEGDGGTEVPAVASGRNQALRRTQVGVVPRLDSRDGTRFLGKRRGVHSLVAGIRRVPILYYTLLWVLEISPEKKTLPCFPGIYILVKAQVGQ